jgi:hypothetical protein
MRKVWFAIPTVLILVLASTPVVMSGILPEHNEIIPSHGSVLNCPPEFDDSSFRLIIINDPGEIVFDSQYPWVDTDGDGEHDTPPKENARPDPYAWNSEKVGVYKKINDCNGLSDLLHMDVFVEVVTNCDYPIIYRFPMGIVEWWEHDEGATGLYYGEFIVPAVDVARGIHGFVFTAIDPNEAEATPEYDCLVYDKDGDGIRDHYLWLNPAIYVDRYPSQLSFPAAEPCNTVEAEQIMDLIISSDSPSGMWSSVY